MRENKQSLIRFLGDYIVKHINQNNSLQEVQSLYLAGLFSNPETVKMLNQITKAHLCCSFLENNVLRGQERPYLGISQQCNLERYSLDTVCQQVIELRCV
jgi:transcriptional regulator CtsR